MLARLIARSKSRPDVSSGRVLFVAAFIGFWMLVISARLVYLQFSQYESLANRARQQQQNEIETSPQRGELLDRQERQLARSVQTVSLFLDPDGIDNATLDRNAQQLAKTLGLKQADLAKEFRDAAAAKKRFIWIARRLDADVANKIVELKLPGLQTQLEPKRYYPNGSLAAHVLGYVGLDGKGLGGVEQFYNAKISGEAGHLLVEKDAYGKPYESYEIAAKSGQTVVLTIDQTIQYQAEQALQAAVQRSHAKSGTVIVLDPRSGEILALANAPTFDPNKVSEAKPETRSNWALQNIYEPGSTFKVVAFSAALEKKLVKVDDHIDCQMGAVTVAGRVVHDHKPFGTLTIAEALAKSSNVAAIKLGMRVGDPAMYDYIRRFGFGSRTGIELPGETNGILRKVERWQPSSIGSIAIGQEVGVTPVQMVAAFGALANDGVRIAPHLIREVRDSGGNVVYRAQPEQRRVISAETAVALRGMLEGVTLNGTAKKAQLDGYSAAGKTGTAQKIDPKTRSYSSTKFVGSFVGFAPVSNPQVAIIVVIDEPAGAYHGGDVAAPVFREVAEQVLPTLNVMPDIETKSDPDLIAQANTNPERAEKIKEEQAQSEEQRKATMPTVDSNGGRSGEVVYAAATKKAMLMPDLRGRSVRDVARACAQLGLQVEARGEGRVTKQNPSAGTEVSTGQLVYVDFGRLQ
ncbi:MAG TPA: penicillin-binding transpeptidase domain-containing protein [Pyrinomonadaceae bacterium]|nr:penicillin-binding transpeptidase domain-containing protein [Pyrinomonadaceae bacterium]